jgi:hypothetical protein
MKRSWLFGYQLLIGLSDFTTGALLISEPEFTLRLMGLDVPPDALPFLSFIGAFVLSVGMACLYGAFLTMESHAEAKLQMVWLLTAMIRSSVAIFVCGRILAGTLESGWLAVAFCDGACALIQAIGLRKGWLADAAH